tara:strand:- start:6732 stop:7787 length:1056 start_codon:yes stop_codon:yes gene_type:complete
LNKGFKFILFVISCLSVLSAGDSSGSSETKDEGVTGEVIVHHIQDGKYFEVLNPTNLFFYLKKKFSGDFNDSKEESNYLHKKENKIYSKLKLYSVDNTDYNKWDKVLPSLGKYLSWKADGSGIKEDPNQLFITKQAIMMFLASLFLILAFTIGYRKNKRVQSGFGNLLEVFVVFIRDEVVYPNMGEKQGRRFLPLILTFFFFIVTLNLMGLIPGSATATASFSVTIGLALITFFTYIIFGNKDFWKHIFATPGVPAWLLPIMIPVEIIGLFTKPFALSVRLLANMNAGHIIILAFLGIIINMKSYGAALGAVPMAIAINMLELFVAFLQGYIFSLLSSIFIGMAVVEHEHH